MLRSGNGLREFCEDIASPEPSPGGGTAAAAAGAIAASLLSMVCGITLRSRKHEGAWPRMSELRDEADRLADELLSLAAQDARAYGMVVEAARARRGAPTDEASSEAYAKAVKGAVEAPMSTASACLEVLRLSAEVGRTGVRSASSDVEVARLLAAAGMEGALANVTINLPHLDDASAASEARERAERLRQERGSLPEP